MICKHCQYWTDYYETYGSDNPPHCSDDKEKTCEILAREKELEAEVERLGIELDSARKKLAENSKWILMVQEAKKDKADLKFLREKMREWSLQIRGDCSWSGLEWVYDEMREIIEEVDSND